MANYKPFSDEQMKYDFEEHRYILTKEYVLKRSGIDLSKVLKPGFIDQPQQRVDNFLNQLSDEIYGWIYEHNADNDYQEYLLAKNPLLRNIIRNAMFQQVLYVLVNGDLNMYSGVNVKSGQIADQRKMVEAAIAPAAKRELNKIIPGIGLAITYQGTWLPPIGYCIREDY